MVKKLVFVCRGNMFRSQLAEGLFNSDPAAGWHAYSFGTCVTDEGLEGITLSEYGKGIALEIEEMKKNGIDISNYHSKQLTPQDLIEADKVIVMSEEEYTPKWLSERNDERWEVANPDFITKEIADQTIALLSKHIKELKKVLS